MADLYVILNTTEILDHLIEYWPERVRSWQGHSLYYKDTACLALLWDPAKTTFWKVVNAPGIEERLETFWPKEYSGRAQRMSLFYKDITVIAYEFLAKWNSQRYELLAWDSPRWSRRRMEQLAGVPIILGEGREAITEALRDSEEGVPSALDHSRRVGGRQLRWLWG